MNNKKSIAIPLLSSFVKKLPRKTKYLGVFSSNNIASL